MKIFVENINPHTFPLVFVRILFNFSTHICFLLLVHFLSRFVTKRVTACLTEREREGCTRGSCEKEKGEGWLHESRCLSCWCLFDISYD